jgi:hypothetical protein
MNLVGLQSLGVRSQVFTILSFLVEFAAQGFALVVDVILVDTAKC